MTDVFVFSSEPQIAAEIMKSVSDTLNRSVFNFTPEYARILTGRNEGCYSWVTVNYLLQTFFQVSQESCIVCQCWFQCWRIVCDAGPTLNQQWINIPCLLPIKLGISRGDNFYDILNLI